MTVGLRYSLIACLAAVVVVVTPVNAAGQDTNPRDQSSPSMRRSEGLAVVIGGSWSSIESSNPNDQFEFSTGPSFGALIAGGQRPLSMQGEVLVSRRVAVNVTRSGRRDRWESWVVEVPVLARARFWENVYLLAGPSFDIRLGNSVDQGFGSRDIDGETKVFGYGWTAGAGVNAGRFLLQFRYLAGLRNMAADGAPTISATLQPRAVVLLGGFFLR